MKKIINLLIVFLIGLVGVYGEEKVGTVILKPNGIGVETPSSNNIVDSITLGNPESGAESIDIEKVSVYGMKCNGANCDIIKKEVNIEDSNNYFSSIEEAKISANYGIIDIIFFKNYIGNENEGNIEITHLNKLKELGYNIDSSFYNNYYSGYETSRKNYLDAQKNYDEEYFKCPDDLCKKTLTKKIDDTRKIFEEEAQNIEQLGDFETAYQFVLDRCTSLDSNSCNDMITTFGDEISCVDSWFPEGLCTFFKDEKLVENAVFQNIQRLEEEAKDDCESSSKEEFSECYNEVFQDNLEEIEIDFTENYAYFCEDGTSSCDDPQKCGSTCKSENLFCDKNDIACKLIKKELDETKKKSLQKMYTETSTAFDVISIIMNPDQNAVLASKLFGFEADYSDLPEWLTEDSASLICLAKIDGYLDTQLETQSEDGVGNKGAKGITQYGCSIEKGEEFNPNTGEYGQAAGQPCIEVLADLRAERTPILPNGEVQITYSGYLRAPSTTNISYMIYVIYKEENKSNPTLHPVFTFSNGSLNPKKLQMGQDDSFYNTLRIPEEGTLKIPIAEEGIKILLQSYFTGGSRPQEYVNIITPVYEITASTYRDPLGQLNNNEANLGERDSIADNIVITQEEDNVIGDDDILNAACKLAGTC